MAQKLKGVGGVLGELISPEPLASNLTEPKPAEQPSSSPQSVETAELTRPVTKGSSRAQPTRRGRPPGQKAGESSGKEKVTLRIDKVLMDEFRDWSWDERCQLGELVERALTQYRKHRSRSKNE